MGNRNINIGQGNYNENVGGNYVDQQIIIDDNGDTIIMNFKGKGKKGKTIRQVSTSGGDNIIGDKILGNKVTQVSQQMFNNMNVGGNFHIGDSIMQISQTSIDSCEGTIVDTSQHINISDNANVNINGAGAFGLGKNKGTIANTINQTIVQQSNTNVSKNNRVSSEKEVELKEPTSDTPSEYRVFKSQVNTIADMIKLSACNMPVDASRIERFMVASEIIERLEKNPDLVKLYKENSGEIKQMLQRELGQTYYPIISLVTFEMQR